MASTIGVRAILVPWSGTACESPRDCAACAMDSQAEESGHQIVGLAESASSGKPAAAAVAASPDGLVSTCTETQCPATSRRSPW